MKRIAFIIINILVFFSLFGLVIFGFWYFGIFKKEPTFSEKMLKMKSQIEFINNYPFVEVGKFFESLPTQIYQLPNIAPEEIGRPALF